jgi:hypothetical protein
MVAAESWQVDYPWLRLAFRQSGAEGKTASEEWRWRIEEDLQAPLDYQVRANGTAAVWCALSRYDFTHEPTPKDLLQGLLAAYRAELDRRGWQYPDLDDPAPADRTDPPIVATRYGQVALTWEAWDALVDELRSRRGSDDLVVRIFEAIGSARPVQLDRKGRIAVFDALWAIAESAGGYDRLERGLLELHEKLTDELATAPAHT